MKEDFAKIKKVLDENKVEYKVSEHEPVYTSEQAARIRGVDIKTGAKSIVVRSKGEFYNFVLSAAKKIDFSKVKKILNLKSVSFASAEEVLKVMHCEIGSVPPFGNLYGLDVYCDNSLLENEYIDFNAGLHTASIRMKSKDWVKIVKPKTADFSKD